MKQWCHENNLAICPVVRRSSERFQLQLQEQELEQSQQGVRNGLGRGYIMRENLSFEYLYSMGNLTLAWRKARKGKTKKQDIIEFEKNLEKNLIALHYELKKSAYFPRPLKTFILRDPKTRKISKSHFRDRIVHHALINIIGQKFQKSFIHDSCANQIGKGTFFALKRFEKFSRKISANFSRGVFCLKADIKHYFEEVDHAILMSFIKRKISDEKTLILIEKIITNSEKKRERVTPNFKTEKGMPLGNLTSQFFANIYLNELDYFVKHKLKVKYYIRYVDDFVIFHSSKKQLEEIKKEISKFLQEKLKLSLHPQKSRIIPLSRGIDFVGFRIFKNFKLLRKRNIRTMRKKINLFRRGTIDFRQLFDSHQGWQAYAQWGNTFNLRSKIKAEIIDAVWDKF